MVNKKIEITSLPQKSNIQINIMSILNYLTKKMWLETWLIEKLQGIHQKSLKVL
jgi:hypothetical protein